MIKINGRAYDPDPSTTIQEVIYWDGAGVCYRLGDTFYRRETAAEIDRLKPPIHVADTGQQIICHEEKYYLAGDEIPDGMTEGSAWEHKLLLRRDV